MKKLIEALHVIQDECTNHYKCSDCPMFSHNNECLFDESHPCDIDIDEVEVNLMRKGVVMQEVFEKIKERLEEKKDLVPVNRLLDDIINDKPLELGQLMAYAEAIEIVNQVAEETNKGEISDGYHTFNELYHHRAILFSVICNSNKELAWKSRLHDTGDMYDGMFIVGIETPEGQATYHYDIEPYWDMFEVKKLQNAPKWDGHTPDEAIRRIGLLGKDINTSSNDGCIPLPKVAFDRMIARMESESERDIYEEESLFINVRDAARIVHEIAEEYKHGHFGCNFNGQHERCVDCGLRGECSHCNTEWFAEYSNSEIPNMSEKVTGSDVPDINVGKNEVEHMLDTIEMRADETWMDYYRKALKGLRELSGKEYNDGWIPCSERLPEERDWYLAVFKEPDTGFIGLPYIADYLLGAHTNYTTNEGWIIKDCTDHDGACEYYKDLLCVAWQPLPAPYKPKGEK